MSTHAKLSASGSATWLNCPGSVRLSANIPNETSSYAQEGTNAHAQAEAMLLGKKDLYPEMAADVQPYIDLVHEYAANEMLMVEERVKYTEWVDGGFGTVDALIVNGDTIVVIDLKFGKGIKVEAEGNSQLRLYALGALQRYQFEHGIEKVITIISQPRLDHVSEETLTVEELLGWGEWVKERAEATKAKNAPPVAGEKQCRWCRARFTCRTRAITTLEDSDNDALTPDDIAFLLPLLPNVTAWVKDIHDHALKLAEDGVHLRGHKLVEGRSIRRFTDEAPEVLRAAGLSDDEIYQPKKLATLGSVEKALGGKKKAAEVLSSCVVKPAGKPALVKLSDPRNEMNSSNITSFPLGE